MRHEEVVKGHREQHELAELAHDELPARLVHHRNPRVDRDEHAAMVRIAKRHGDTAADVEPRGVLEEIAAQRIVAEFRRIPDVGQVAVVSPRDAGIDFDVAALPVQLDPFARKRRPYVRARIAARGLRIGRHAVHEAVEAQLGHDFRHHRLQRLPLQRGLGQARDVIVDDVAGYVSRCARIDDRKHEFPWRSRNGRGKPIIPGPPVPRLSRHVYRSTRLSASGGGLQGANWHF